VTKQTWLQSQLLPNEDRYLAVTRLNMPTLVPNPVPQGTIPKKATIPELLKAVTPAERYSVGKDEIFRLAMEAYNTGNSDDAIAWFNVLVENDKLSPESAQAVGALLAETISDPSWQPMVELSLAEQAGYGFVSYEEIAEAIATP